MNQPRYFRGMLLLILFGVLIYGGWTALERFYPNGPTVRVGLSDAVPGITRIRLDGIFDPQQHLEPAQPTIIEFYADYCPGCRRLHQEYGRFLPLRPDVAVRQIRLPDDWTPQAIMHEHGVHIRAIPHILIYGPDGSLIAKDNGTDSEGFDFLFAWMNYEIRKTR